MTSIAPADRLDFLAELLCCGGCRQGADARCPGACPAAALLALWWITRGHDEGAAAHAAAAAAAHARIRAERARGKVGSDGTA